MSKIITASEAARVLHVDRGVVLKLLANGEIPAMRLGNRWKIDEDQLEEWFRSKSIREAKARRELSND